MCLKNQEGNVFKTIYRLCVDERIEGYSKMREDKLYKVKMSHG